MNARSKEFFEKFVALCAEYEVTLSGCGCCESPSMRIAGENFDEVQVSHRDLADGTKHYRIVDDEPTGGIDRRRLAEAIVAPSGIFVKPT